jgi:hypothetical protein
MMISGSIGKAPQSRPATARNQSEGSNARDAIEQAIAARLGDGLASQVGRDRQGCLSSESAGPRRHFIGGSQRELRPSFIGDGDRK